MTLYTQLRSVLVDAAYKDAANSASYVFDPDTGGAETFVVGISPTGELPATHFVCSTLFTQAAAELLDSEDATNLHASLVLMASERGREYTATLEESQDLRNHMQVSTKSLYELMEERELQFVI